MACRPQRKVKDKEKEEKDNVYSLSYLTLNAQSATNTPVETEIVGSIPEWLEGSLYRNGPGIFRVGEANLKHLFDGFAILHRFHLHRGKVTYMSRVLDTDTWEKSVKANRLVAFQFGTYTMPDPCKNIFSRIMSFFKSDEEESDNTPVNIVEYSDRLYTMTETPHIVRVHPETLLKEGKEDYRQVIAVHMSTAHPHFDHQGNMYNLGTAFNTAHNYKIIKMPPVDSAEADAVSSAQLVTSVKSRWKFTLSYNHSFGMSAGHFIILEQPVVMKAMKFVTSSLRKAPPYENFRKLPEEELVFHVVRRSDNQEVNIKYRAEPAFTFHFINCHEDQGHLVVDLVGYRDVNAIDNLYLHRLDPEGNSGSDSYFRRYVLPLSLEKATKGENLVQLPNTTATAVLRADGTVYLTPDYLVEGGVLMELPTINYNQVNGIKYRYVYATVIFVKVSKLIKIDLDQKKVMTWEDEGYLPGEPVFVPRPGATKEDEGVVLSPVLGSREDQRCYLVVLDAATFKELGRAYTPAGVKMSVTFHGTYVQPKTERK